MAQKRAKVTNVRREALGILLQGVWVLLLLALVSYDSRDTADWASGGRTIVNYIGPVGAWSAWAVFNVFGLGGFVLPLLLATWGVLMILQSGERVWPRVLWMLGIQVGICILMDMQTDFWQSFSDERFNVHSMPGGLTGLFLGRMFLTRYLGQVGAAIISLVTIVSGIFFVSQTHPADLWLAAEEVWRRWRARREARAASRRTLQEQAEREARRLEKERERLERELARERRRLEKEEQRRRRERELEERRDALRREEEERARRERESAEAREREEAARKQEFLRRLAEQRRSEEEKKPAREPAAKPPVREDAASRPPAAPAPEAPPAVAPAAWSLPPMSLLAPVPEGSGQWAGPDELDRTIRVIRGTLAEFGIEADVTHVEQGPVVTRYELLPAAGIKLERIANLQANITLALKADSIRVQAPIPGKGVVGIEVPNRQPAPVVLRTLLESAVWTSSKAALPLALGQDVGGHVLVADLATLPHLLIAGATGQGKTVCMNTILAGLLMSRTPDEMRLILIDPKIVEFSGYNDLPHLMAPVITDAKKVVTGLRWAIQEMERRFKLFHRVNVRDIRGYNQRPKEEQPALFATPNGGTAAEEEPEEPPPERLPYIVIIIDELADLMLMAQQEIEPQIQKLTQLARATGIHMIIATQRPTVDIITGTIKSNIPGRIAFKVAQKNDSRVIIDQEGADKLVGRGDMLVLTAANKLIRAQGALTRDTEIQAIVEHWKRQGKPQYEAALRARIEEKAAERGESPEEDEELLQQAIEVIRQTRRASTSAIQRRLRLGYTRAARLMDILEEKGLVGPPRGSEAREILFPLDDLGSTTGPVADDHGGPPADQE